MVDPVADRPAVTGEPVGGPDRGRRWGRALLWFTIVGVLVAGLSANFLLDITPLMRAATRPWCPSGAEEVAVHHARTEGFAGYHHELECLSAGGEATPVSVWRPMVTMFAASFVAYTALVLLVVTIAPPLLRLWFRHRRYPQGNTPPS